MKRTLVLLILMLLLTTIVVPAALALADGTKDGNNKITSFDDIEEGVPITVYYDDKGNLKEIKYGVPDGSKVEVLKEKPPTDKHLGVMHNRTFDLWDNSDTWYDYSHAFHMLEAGDQQAAWCSWTPDSQTACFVGMYYSEGQYAVGLVRTSANNVLTTASKDGLVKPWVVYYGDNDWDQKVHFTCNYWPDW